MPIRGNVVPLLTMPFKYAAMSMPPRFARVRNSSNAGKVLLSRSSSHDVSSVDNVFACRIAGRVLGHGTRAGVYPSGASGVALGSRIGKSPPSRKPQCVAGLET